MGKPYMLKKCLKNLGQLKITNLHIFFVSFFLGFVPMFVVVTSYFSSSYNIDFSTLLGKVATDTTIHSQNTLDGQVAEVALEEGTILKTQTGRPFTGTLYAPKFLDTNIAAELTGQEVLSVLDIGGNSDQITLENQSGSQVVSTVKMPAPGQQEGTTVHVNYSHDGVNWFAMDTAQVIIEDGEPYAQFETTHFTIFSISLPIGGFSINQNDFTTSTNSVTLNSNVFGATQMRFSNTQAGLTSASWVSYATGYARNITAVDGYQTVYAEFNGPNGGVIQDTIFLDTTTLSPNLRVRLSSEMSGTTVLDSTANGFDFSAIGGLSNINLLGESTLSLNGTSQYAEIGSIGLTAYPFTFSAWVNASATGIANTIVSVGNSATATTYYSIQLTNGYPAIAVRNTTSYVATSPALISTGRWYHVVGVFNSATDRRLYVNGDLHRSDTQSATFSATNQQVRVGRLVGTTTNYFNGYISDVRIYNKSLSTTEIQTIYKSHTKIDEPIQYLNNAEFMINTGDSSTYSTAVTLNSTVSGVTEMRFSNTEAGLTSASWVPYAPSYAWTLDSVVANKTVYAQYSGVNGVREAQDSIFLDSSTDTNLRLLLAGGLVGTTITDSTANGFDFTAVGTPTNPMVNNQQVFSLNGTSQYGERNGTVISAYPFTFSAWINPDTIAGTDSIVAMGRSNSTTRYYTLDLVNGAPSITARNTTARTTTSTHILSTGQWYHVVGVFASATSRSLYVNGVLEGTNTTSVTLDTTSQQIRFGRYNSTAANYFDGYMDDVRVYNKVLSVAEIQALTQARTTRLVRPTATVSYDKLFLTSGSVVATLTGFSENITILNNAGNDTYTFTDNGNFTFLFKDDDGNVGSTISYVNWIDNTAPTFAGVVSGAMYADSVQITFSDPNLSGATLNGLPYVSGATISDPGEYVFVVEDLVGNSTGATFSITNAPKASIEYTPGSGTMTTSSVVATLTGFNKTGIVITNNSGLDTYTFDWNGSFTFQLEDGEGLTGEVTATVDWIRNWLSYSTTTFYENQVSNNGSIDNSIVLTLGNGAFSSSVASYINMTNIPTGLTGVFTLSGANKLIVSLTGSATNHAATNSINNISISLLTGAFSGYLPSEVLDSTKTGIALNFSNPNPTSAIYSSADTTLDADSAAEHGCANGACQEYNYGAMTFGGLADFGSKMLIKFDVSTLPAGAIVTSATLRLTKLNLGGTPTDNGTAFKLRKVINNTGWIEGTKNGATATAGEPNYKQKKWTQENWYNGDPGLVSSLDYGTTDLLGISGFTGAAQAEYTQTMPLSEDGVNTIQDWLYNPTTNQGFALVEPDQNWIYIRTKEYATVANRPLLNITYMLDTWAPQIINMTPMDNTNNVVLDSDLSLTFNEYISPITGKNIYIKKSVDDSIIETIDVTDTGLVLLSNDNKNVTIFPTNVFESNTGYYVEIDSGAFVDRANNSFGSISGSTIWNFTTLNADLVPGIISETFSNIAYTTVTLGADITSTGLSSITTRGFVWSLIPGFDIVTANVLSETGTWNTTGSFSLNASGFASGSTIYFRGFAANSEGTGYTTESSFVLKPDIVSLNATTMLSNDTFKINRSPVTGATQYQVYVSTGAGCTSYIPGYDPTVSTGTSQKIINLERETTYYYKVIAVNSGGLSPSSAIHNTTTSFLPRPWVWLKFEETAGAVAYDSSENFNNGVIYGPPLMNQTGAENKAFEFDGTTDFVAVTDFDIDPDFTLSFWFKKNITGNNEHLFSYGDDTDANSINVVLDDASKSLKTYINGSQTILNITGSVYSGLIDNAWHFYSLTVADDESVPGKKLATVYVDGITKLTDSSLNAGVFNPTTSMNIGKKAGTPTGTYYKGLIDDVRFYGKILTSPEIFNLYAMFKDTIAPTATITYQPSPIVATDNSVLATLTGASEPIVITNNGGLSSYTFTQNGIFTFTYRDEGFNTGETTASVYWINPILAPITGAEVNTRYLSDTITLTGMSDGISTGVSLIGSGVIFKNGVNIGTSGTGANNDEFYIRINSSLSGETTFTGTINIGITSSNFSVTTKKTAFDVIPDSFNFAPIGDANLGTYYFSNTITITGLDIAVPLSLTGAGSIFKNGTNIGTGGTGFNGDEIAIRIRSSTLFARSRTGILDIGGVTGEFIVTTLADYIEIPSSIDLGVIRTQLVASGAVQGTGSILPMDSNTILTNIRIRTEDSAGALLVPMILQSSGLALPIELEFGADTYIKTSGGVSYTGIINLPVRGSESIGVTGVISVVSFGNTGNTQYLENESGDPVNATITIPVVGKSVGDLIKILTRNGSTWVLDKYVTVVSINGSPYIEISTSHLNDFALIDTDGIFVINGDLSVTPSQEVTLNNAVHSATGMRFSNDGSNWSTWEGYTNTKGWTLIAGSGMKTVYVQFMSGGNLIELQDTIQYIPDTNKIMSFYKDLTGGNSSSTFDIGVYSASYSAMNVSSDTNHRFVVDDNIGNGFVVTMQASDMIAGANIISADNISYNATPWSVSGSLLTSAPTGALDIGTSPVTFVARNNANGTTYAYQDLTLKIQIPAAQAPGSYQGVLTFTY